MEYGSLYFYTTTINNWRPLIHQYGFYNAIADSLSFLHEKNCVKVYGFVIMPNHMHLIWQSLKPNGKESPVASLMKFTAHHFQKTILQNQPEDLLNYKVNSNTRKYNFWQPEPDWFLLTNPKTTLQKLNYIHNNPLQLKWNLVANPADYYYSSAKFYETGVTNFDFLYHYDDFDDKCCR
jgi:putative transposase